MSSVFSCLNFPFSGRAILLGACLLTGGTATGRAESLYATPYSFTTLAGLPSIGSADGTGAAARFYYPLGVAVDSAGNTYVADEKNQTIRKITPAGVVTTLAGAAGYRGYVDGPAAAARFNLPKGVAVDSAGNVYVADAGNHAIRKLTPAGEVSTLAGNGSGGSAVGTGIAARFNIPSGLAVDAAGTLYVADSINNTVRKVTAAGVVTTLAGTAGIYGSADGTGPAAGFFYPLAVAVDAAGTVYVTEIGNNTVRKISPVGVVTTLAGKAGTNGAVDGTGAEARFRSPEGIAADSAGNLFVVDRTVRKITPAGVVTTLAGHPDQQGSTDGTGSEARFRKPSGIAVDAAGNLMVADRDDNTIRRITPAAVVTTFAGVGLDASAGSADGTGQAARFREPAGIAVSPAGELYLADTDNQTLRKIAANGAVTTLAGSPGLSGGTDGTGAAARFSNPFGMAVDAAGNVYAAMVGDSTIRKVTPAGVVTTLAGSSGLAGSEDGTGAGARFRNPEGVAVDSAGNLYVSDTANHTIRKVTPGGLVSTLAGYAGIAGSADGPGAAARFREPAGLTVDDAGNVYVADWANHTVRKISPSGVVSTLAGRAGTPGAADGAGAAARFQWPSGVAVDGEGAVYVADTLNQTVRKITAAGMVTTLAGLTEVRGSAAGKGEAVRFDHPVGVAVGATGRLYVTNRNAASNSVYQGQLAGLPLITAQPQGATVTAGANVQFTVTATADPAPTYQWYRNGTAITGATDATFTLSNAQTANAGDYTVVVTNTLGSATSEKATLAITTPPPPPPPASPSGGGGGGGGAPSPWFLGALLGLWLVRRLGMRRAG